MKLINIRMEINEETELINKNNNVIKFLLQYNRANFEISKSKKKIIILLKNLNLM